MTTSDPFANRFTLRAATEDGVVEVHDETLNLIWRQQPESEGGKTEFTWPEALALAWRRREHSAHNWRLPTVEELSGLLCVDKQTGDIRRPEWFRVGEEVDASVYWTSSPVAGDADLAWLVLFGNGVVVHGHHGGHVRVRLLRSAPGEGERSVVET